MARSSPLRTLAWLIVAFFALVGLVDFVAFFFGVNLFEAFTDFITSLIILPLMLAAGGDNGDGGPVTWERIKEWEMAEARTHRMKMERIKRWLVAGLGLAFCLLILLAVVEPTSTFVYWTGEAIAHFFAAAWWILTTFGFAILAFLVGISLETKLPVLTYRVQGDHRQKKKFIHPGSIEVLDGCVVKVDDFNGNTFWSLLQQTVWRGWRVDVSGLVIPERKGKNVWLKDAVEGRMDKYKQLREKYEKARQENEEMRYQLLQRKRMDKLTG